MTLGAQKSKREFRIQNSGDRRGYRSGFTKGYVFVKNYGAHVGGQEGGHVKTKQSTLTPFSP